MSEVLFPGSVTLAALNSMDGQCGGITSCFYTNETEMRWQKSRVVTSLAGMAAVENKFGFVGAGSYKDIKSASSTLRSMMEDEGIAGFGLTGYGYHNSEELNHHQEIANSALLNQYYIKAKEILAKNFEFFSSVIDKLDSDNIITMEDIEYLHTICDIYPVELG